MYLLTLLFAWLQMRGSQLVGNAWWDVFLDKMVGVETFFYHASWWVWGVAVVVGIIMVLLGVIGRSSEFTLSSLGCLSCGGVILLLWPLFEYLSVLTIAGMADGFGPVGVINGGFYICLVLYVSFIGLL